MFQFKHSLILASLSQEIIVPLHNFLIFPISEEENDDFQY